MVRLVRGLLPSHSPQERQRGRGHPCLPAQVGRQDVPRCSHFRLSPEKPRPPRAPTFLARSLPPRGAPRERTLDEHTWQPRSCSDSGSRPKPRGRPGGRPGRPRAEAGTPLAPSQTLPGPRQSGRGHTATVSAVSRERKRCAPLGPTGRTDGRSRGPRDRTPDPDCERSKTQLSAAQRSGQSETRPGHPQTHTRRPSLQVWGVGGAGQRCGEGPWRAGEGGRPEAATQRGHSGPRARGGGGGRAGAGGPEPLGCL